MVRQLTVRSREKAELIDITAQVEELVAGQRVLTGCCDIFVPHTTAGVTVNEGADPAVKRDIVHFLDKLVPNAPYFTHAEGNSAAHVKATLTGCSVRLLIEKGKLLLGTWQAIYFCEYDGPRERKVMIRIGSED